MHYSDLLTAAGSINRQAVAAIAAERAQAERAKTICVFAGVKVPGRVPYGAVRQFYADAAAKLTPADDIPPLSAFLRGERRAVLEIAKAMQAARSTKIAEAA